MNIEKNQIAQHNDSLLTGHQQKLNNLKNEWTNTDLEKVIKKLVDFQIAIPSWALGTGGTRFGRFAINGGEPRNIEEKIQDVGLLHALNASSGAISLHIPWDIPQNPDQIKNLAASYGLKFDAVNSNTFQDQPGAPVSYKFGSLQHVDKAVRQQAIEHNIEVIKQGVALGSESLTVWLADGSCFPGQLNFRKAFENTLSSLKEIYAALPANWKMFVEYKAYEPNFYSTTVGDWGQSLLYANKLGEKAYTLVDLGHHLPNANIEQIVSLLLMEGKLGGFHFNDSKYGDDDLTTGSIKPYQLFLIFNELVEGMDAKGMDHATGLGWMIDASHNVKDPLEDLLQSIEAIMIAYAQALLVDRKALTDAQQNNDVVLCQEILQHTFRSDLRALVAEARLRAGAALSPLNLYRGLDCRKTLVGERGQNYGSYRFIRKAMPIPVIAIFDVGKTNKKLFLIDENYHIVYERSARFVETVDEDGEPCENLESLRSSVYDSLQQVSKMEEYDIKAINFSTYGASFVYLDENGDPLTPLYNYLKAYPEALKKEFYAKYGGEEQISRETASPILGSLNSGLQLYRLKKERPALFAKVKWALHLPQYLSYLITGKAVADITSIGCHTHLWDFTKNEYHRWVIEEGLDCKFGDFTPGDSSALTDYEGKNYHVGVGLHDSSAALIPYLANFSTPFVLLSTGTWCISLNPFNQDPLTAEELKQDCLCYMHFKGKAVKASRIFAGNEHEQQLKRIADHFDRAAYLFKHLKFNPGLFLKLGTKVPENAYPQTEFTEVSAFGKRDLALFKTAEEAYHQLIMDLVKQQIYSLRLVLNSGVKRVFVDGGFGKNAIYMHLLAISIPDIEVYASSVSQATAIGTALSINDVWNANPIPNDIIELKYYSFIQRTL